MNKIKYIWTLCAALVLMGFTACNDDNDSGCSSSSAITIDKVFLQNVKDKAHPDREVSFARLGQLVRIQGSGFTGLRHIYINGYDTYFNNALMTDNNVWVQLNSKTLVGDKADADKRNTIVFENDNGSYTYDFEVRAASPQITSFHCSLPTAGEKVVAYGTSLEEISSITLPSGTEITDGIESDPDGEWFSFTMPANETVGGSLLFEGVNGKGKSPTYFNNMDCYILNFENDGHGVQGSWPKTKSETGSMIYADDLANDPLNSGRGKVHQVIPDRLLTNGIDADKDRATECWTGGNDESTDDWTRMKEFISGDTPVENLALQFDVYVPESWSNTGYLEITFGNDYNINGINGDDNNNNKAVIFWIPWLKKVDGKWTVSPFVTESGWQTITIPLTEVVKYASEISAKQTPTLQEVIDDRNAAKNRNFGFHLINKNITMDKDKDSEATFTSSVCKQLIYTDNWRIVNTENFTVSDFDDAETE